MRARKAPRTTGAARISRPVALRAQIARTVQLVPEVMVKITNRKGVRNGMGAIRAHLDYISRNGQVELEAGNGNPVPANSKCVILSRCGGLLDVELRKRAHVGKRSISCCRCRLAQIGSP